MDDLTDEAQREWLNELKRDFRNPVCLDPECAHVASEHHSRGSCLHKTTSVNKNTRGFSKIVEVSCPCDMTPEEVFYNRHLRSIQQLGMIDHAIDYAFAHGLWPTKTHNQKQIPSEILSSPCEPGEIPNFPEPPKSSMHQNVDEDNDIWA